MLKTVKQYYVWIIFAVAAAAQIWIPLHTVVESYDIRATGREFRIQTAPVDPADPFRGRYVAIDVSVDVPERLQDKNLGNGVFYIRLTDGEDGFAKVLGASATPLIGEDVLKLDTGWSRRSSSLQLPFDRYYMAEKLAPEAERIYRDASRRNDEELTAYVTIRVKNGRAVVSGMYIDGIRIEDYVRTYLRQNQ